MITLAKAQGAGVLAVVAAAGVLGYVLWRKSQVIVKAVTDAAPAGATGVDLAIAGAAGALGQAYGLPTPRQISDDRTSCVNSTGWFAASKACSASDFVKWVRGDFNVSSAYPDESVRGSRAAVTTAR